VSFVLIIVGVLVLTAILNILIIQSNNFLFMIFKRPFWWMLFMEMLSFITFLIGSRFENSFNVVWLSSFFALLLNIPRRKSKNMRTAIDEVYSEIGVKHGRIKYWMGLASYIFGGVIGWVLFYGRIVQQGT
jgi:hypothetical protein